MKVPDVAPAGIVMVSGTVTTEVSQLVRDTVTPRAGAAMVNVAVAVLPVLAVPGLTDRLARARLEVTASTALSVELLYVALMMALTLPFAGVVVTLTVPDVLPALTVTIAGTTTAVFLLDSDITAPTGGAGPMRITVAVDGLPAATLVGLIIISDRVAAVTVSVAVLSTPLWFASIVMAAVAATPIVVTGDVAIVLSAVTVTVAGTVAAALLADRHTRHKYRRGAVWLAPA